MVRRIFYILNSFYVETVVFQVMNLIFMNLFMIIYTGLVCPLETKLRNRLELFNEACIDIACLHLFVFTDWVNLDN